MLRKPDTIGYGVLFSFLLKQQCLTLQLKMNVRKAVETFCIFKINIVGSNFHAQNVLVPNIPSALIMYGSFISSQFILFYLKKKENCQYFFYMQSYLYPRIKQICGQYQAQNTTNHVFALSNA